MALFNWFNNKKILSSTGSYPFPTADFKRDSEYKLWVYACANALADEIANIQFVLEDRSVMPASQEMSHPVLDLLNAPYNIMSKYQLMFLTSLHISLYGEAYWKIPREGQPMELIPLYPNVIQPYSENNMVLQYYDYNGQRLEVSEVIRFINPDPNNYIRGKGYIDALKDVLVSDKKASETQIAAFDNNSIPSGVLSTEQKLSKEDMDDLKNSFHNLYKGTKNAGKIAVLQKGLSFHAVTSTLKELELLPLRQDHKNVIMGVMKTSPAILGISESTNRATAEANDYTYALRVIKPQMQLIVDSINQWLMPRYQNGRSNLVLTFKTPVPRDKEFELQRLSDSLKWKSINELRAEEGLPSVEGGEYPFQQLGNAPLPAFRNYDDVEETIRDN